MLVMLQITKDYQDYFCYFLCLFEIVLHHSRWSDSADSGLISHGKRDYV